MTFFAPLFFLGLLGVALPLWLHRMNYSNPETRPFTATFLLKHTKLTAATEQRLRYLLLLAARLLALILLVLLFAKPALERDATAALDEADRTHYLVVDTSLSMAAEGRFAQAVGAARQVLDDLPGEARVQLFSMGENLAALSAVTSDRDEIRRLLERLEPGTGSMDYGVAMQQLNALVRSANTHRDLVLISDLQRSNLPERFADLVPAAASSMQLVPVGEEQTNARVTATWNQGQLAVAFTGALPAQPGELEIWLNGNLLRRELLAPGARQLDFDLSALQLLPGGNRFELRWLAEDDLAADNRFFLAVDRSVRQRVLILTHRPDLSDGLFVETALDTLSEQGVDLNTRFMSDSGRYNLADYDLVVATDLGALPASLRSDLEGFVRDGGNLLAALGQASLSLSQVPLSGDAIRADGLPGPSASRQSLVASSTAHPLLDNLNLGNAISLYRWVSLSPANGSRVIVQLGSGEPWALEHRLGNGRLLLFTSPLDSSWSNLPLAPAFVPLLTNALQWLSATYVAPEGLQTGSSLMAGRSADSAISVPLQQIIGPSATPLLELSQLNQVNLVKLTEPGVYELQAATSSSYVAINTPTAESDLTPMAAEQSSRWIELANAAPPELVAGMDPAGPGSQWQSFENWLLLLVLLVILAESIAANAHLRVRRQVAR